MSYHLIVDQDWADQHRSATFFRTLAMDEPLLFLHNLLDGLEARIVAKLRCEYGAEAEEIWERYPCCSDCDEIVSKTINGHWLTNYIRLRDAVCALEQREIAELRKEFAA